MKSTISKLIAVFAVLIELTVIIVLTTIITTAEELPPISINPKINLVKQDEKRFRNPTVRKGGHMDLDWGISFDEFKTKIKDSPACSYYERRKINKRKEPLSDTSQYNSHHNDIKVFFCIQSDSFGFKYANYSVYFHFVKNKLQRVSYESFNNTDVIAEIYKNNMEHIDTKIDGENEILSARSRYPGTIFQWKFHKGSLKIIKHILAGGASYSVYYQNPKYETWMKNNIKSFKKDILTVYGEGNSVEDVEYVISPY